MDPNSAQAQSAAAVVCAECNGEVAWFVRYYLIGEKRQIRHIYLCKAHGEWGIFCKHLPEGSRSPAKDPKNFKANLLDISRKTRHAMSNPDQSAPAQPGTPAAAAEGGAAPIQTPASEPKVEPGPPAALEPGSQQVPAGDPSQDDEVDVDANPDDVVSEQEAAPIKPQVVPAVPTGRRQLEDTANRPLPPNPARRSRIPVALPPPAVQAPSAAPSKDAGRKDDSKEKSPGGGTSAWALLAIGICAIAVGAIVAYKLLSNSDPADKQASAQIQQQTGSSAPAASKNDNKGGANGSAQPAARDAEAEKRARNNELCADLSAASEATVVYCSLATELRKLEAKINAVEGDVKTLKNVQQWGSTPL